MKNWLRGGVRVCVEGRNLERLLAKIAGEIPVCDVRREKSDRISLSIDFKNSGKLFAIIDKTCYNIMIVKTWGLLPLVSGWKKRIGLIAAGGLLAAALGVFSCFIWKVDIEAGEGFDCAALGEYLAELGVRPGVWASSVSEDDVERQVYLRFSDAAFVSCERVGVALKVKIVKALNDVITSPKEGEDLLSRHGGVVSRVIVTSGTALVSPGDKVEAGQPLIAAYRESESRREPCAALGEVYVVQNTEYSEIVPLKREIRTRTGKWSDEKTMWFFGAVFPVKSGGSEFDEYDTEEFSYYPFENNLLPIRVDVKRRYEVLVTTEDINFDKGKNIYYEYALANALAGIEGSYTLINSVIEDRAEGGSQVIEVLLQIERRAG